MKWREAIEESSCGSATRKEEMKNGFVKTMIRYEGGDGYIMVAKKGKVDFDKCRLPKKYELIGFDDWKPSKTK